MDNNLNLAEALAVWDAAAKDTVPSEEILVWLDDVFGLKLVETSVEINLHQKGLILEREKRKKEKDFAGADEIRDELAKAGIKLLDVPSGTVWQYV